LDEVSNLCGRIDWSGLEGNIACGVLEPIAAFLGAETASFRWLSRTQNSPKPVTLGIPESVNEAYVDRYHKLDPARRLVGRRLEGPLFASAANRGEWSNEEASAEKLERYRAQFLQYRREFLWPNNFYHHVGFCLSDPQGRTLLFDFHRMAESREFGELERARARIVAVYMQAKAGACKHVAPGGCAPALDNRLSARELEVAEAVAMGLSNKQIAATLHISVRTVENHMRSIFYKLGVTTRTRLAAKLYEASFGDRPIWLQVSRSGRLRRYRAPPALRGAVSRSMKHTTMPSATPASATFSTLGKPYASAMLPAM
jgi:DNA-binding CsgD family transcriptional regulator